MVATYEIMLESKLGGNSAHRRRGSSISSVASVIKESSSMSSESKIWNTLTHKEVVEVNGGPTGTTDQRFGNFGDLLPDTPIPRHRYSRSKESGLRQEPKSSRRAGTGVAHREINQYPLQYPGAAAQSRCFGTGFRWIEGANSAGISPPRLNINGANTYQFVMGNPVGATDPLGFCECSDCLRRALEQYQKNRARTMAGYSQELQQFGAANRKMALAQLGQALRNFGWSGLIGAATRGSETGT
jgi:hypothetical protein